MVTIVRTLFWTCGVPAFFLLLTQLSAEDRPVEASNRSLRPVDWRPVYQGISLANIECGGKPPIRGKALRIDVTAPGIQFVLTPGNGDEPGETVGMKTTTFVARTKCQIAINAAPFSPIHFKEGLPQDIKGLHVIRGDIVSKPQEGYSALLFSRENVPSISEGPYVTSKLFNAVGGFSVVLRAGTVIAKRGGARHPRTAAGISADKKQLYLLVVDGRQPGHSEGATTQEIGRWLKQLNSDDGINLDGGGTSTLVMADANGTPQVVNRPIHAGIPGMQRVGGSHLGVIALPLGGEKDP